MKAPTRDQLWDTLLTILLGLLMGLPAVLTVRGF